MTRNNIYETLRDRIISGEMAEGDKIIDSDIADEFHVSRTPVREALKRLEMQGLVRSYPGNATLVSYIDRSSIDKPYILMTALQQIAAGEAAKLAGKPIWRSTVRSSTYRVTDTTGTSAIPCGYT